MSRVLVIGSTGNIGRAVIAQLAASGSPVRAFTRDPDAAQFPASVETVRGDLTHPATLDRALEGIETVFLIWTAPAGAIPAAMERITKLTRRIVFLSAPLKTPHPFFQQPNAARKAPETIEPLIEDSGVEWTFLRPGMLAANALLWWAPRIRAGQTVRWPYLSVPAAPIDERDIAAVALRALTEAGHSRAEYVLTGPQSLTHRDQISIIGKVLGRPIPLEEISPDEARRELVSLFPLFVVNMLLDAWRAAAGLPAYMTSTVEAITGAPARSFETWVTDGISHFRQMN